MLYKDCFFPLKYLKFITKKCALPPLMRRMTSPNKGWNFLERPTKMCNWSIMRSVFQRWWIVLLILITKKEHGWLQALAAAAAAFQVCVFHYMVSSAPIVCPHHMANLCTQKVGTVITTGKMTLILLVQCLSNAINDAHDRHIKSFYVSGQSEQWCSEAVFLRVSSSNTFSLKAAKTDLKSAYKRRRFRSVGEVNFS